MKASKRDVVDGDALAAVTAAQRAAFHGFQDERRQLQALLAATVDHGESNSVLLLGQRGAGKTALLEAALGDRDLDASDCRLVRLHGLTETSDRLALKKIAAHLRLDGLVGDKVFGSFAEHLDFLLSSLRKDQNSRSASSVIFVLEEFDLFCAHHNQTLLYNLFDIAQAARKIPNLVIGLTARIDVIEILEKRVQSRFSRRTIHVRKPTTFREYSGFVRHFLLDCNDLSSHQWKKSIKILLDETKTEMFFETLFNRNSLVSFLKQMLHLALLNAQDDEVLTLGHLQDAADNMFADLELPQIMGLPMLDLTLLVSAMHLEEIRGAQQFNFEMAFADYQKFVLRKCSLLRHDRSVMIKCWENLLNLEIIRPAERGIGGSGRVQKEYRACCLNVMPSEIQEAVKTYDGLFMAVKEWAKKGLEE